MTMTENQWRWLDPSETVDAAELALASGLTTDEVSELVDYGALVPVHALGPGAVFSAGYIVSVRTVVKLRRAFDLDLFTTGMLIGYVERIDALERELAALQARAGDPATTGS